MTPEEYREVARGCFEQQPGMEYTPDMIIADSLRGLLALALAQDAGAHP